MDQRSEEWFQQRLGKGTASKANDMRSKTGVKRKNYAIRLLTERRTQMPVDSFVSPAMEWGTENEPIARMAYQLKNKDSGMAEVGFLLHPTIENFGASPDGFVDKDGLIEIKCPNSTTHIEWILAGKVPTTHKNQMIAQLVCTGRQWCDFVSFDPRVGEDIELFVVRFEPTAKEREELEKDVTEFLAEVDEMENQLTKLGVMNARVCD
jgi:putative phage-type endonuclease